MDEKTLHDGKLLVLDMMTLLRFQEYAYFPPLVVFHFTIPLYLKHRPFEIPCRVVWEMEIDAPVSWIKECLDGKNTLVKEKKDAVLDT